MSHSWGRRSAEGGVESNGVTTAVMAQKLTTVQSKREGQREEKIIMNRTLTTTLFLLASRPFVSAISRDGSLRTLVMAVLGDMILFSAITRRHTSLFDRQRSSTFVKRML